MIYCIWFASHFSLGISINRWYSFETTPCSTSVSLCVIREGERWMDAGRMTRIVRAFESNECGSFWGFSGYVIHIRLIRWSNVCFPLAKPVINFRLLQTCVCVCAVMLLCGTGHNASHITQARTHATRIDSIFGVCSSISNLIYLQLNGGLAVQTYGMETHIAQHIRKHRRTQTHRDR